MYAPAVEQARSTPGRSALSVAGLVKHVTHGMRGAIAVLAADEPPALDPAAIGDYLAHPVEEMARHAGHADILREQVDGVSVPTLVMTRAGVPANPFFQPYVPQPGTITA